MQLYYCAKCGLRLSNDECARIAPEEEAANILCAACAPVPVAAAKASESAGTAFATKGIPSTPHTPAMPARPVTKSRTEIRIRTPAAGSGASARGVNRSGQGPARVGQSGQPQATKSVSQPSTKTNTVIYAMGGVGAVALLLTVVLLCGSNSKSEAKDRVAQANTPNPDSAKAEAAKTDVLKKTERPKAEKAAESKAAEPPPRSAFAPIPVEDASPSPKEDYERRVRAGLAKPASTAAAPADKPAEAAPASGPLPAYSADDPTWHLLFNGKDLSGWHDDKGHFSVEGVCLDKALTTPNSCVGTDVAYGDFDLNLKVMVVEGNRYAEVSLRNLALVYPLPLDKYNVWREVRVSAHGQTVRATIDGENLAPEGTPGSSGSGEISIYVPSNSHLKVKDITIRTGH